MFERHNTGRLLLHAIAAEDVDDLSRMHTNPEVMATLGGIRTREYTEQVVRDLVSHWNTHGFGLWMVYDIESGRFAGRGGLKHTNIEGRDVVEVAYAFMPEFWGRGLATELASESVRVAFETLQLPELACFTMVTNRASQRTMHKVGFRYERDFIYSDLPHVFCRLTRTDWLQRWTSSV